MGTPIGEVSNPAFARLPDPGTVFATRAARLAALAGDNVLGPYLTFLSHIADAQHAAQAALPPAVLPGLSRHTMPPLSAGSLSDGHGFADTLEWLVGHAAAPEAPEAAEHARAVLLGMAWAERLELAEAVFRGAYPVEQLGECLYVAAALQVHLARQAALLDETGLKPVEAGACPACGSGPVASVIVGWASASRARYCCCALCGTMWHHVRIKCTACGATGGIAYYTIEGGSKDIAIETCTACRAYIKHLHQHRDVRIDPVADDIATFGLDMLAREENFHRATVNPLMAVL